ncbi:acyl-CoA N-acyltransferase [Panaeolus papilionaceus]|nr:acyl-CoA N-acyltransferase [Panaeolus papilionaceus]
MSMCFSKVVRFANKASAQDIQSHLTSEYKVSDWSVTLQVQHSTTLDETQRTSVWAIFETNMYNLYVNSSFGWDPLAKRRELFDPLSRFILIYSESNAKLVAFVMFRFEMEEEENIIYCYDIQVDSSLQGSGLGNKLLEELSTLCKVYNMRKVMLTVLHANTRALAFYQKIGFVIDSTSPGYITGKETERFADMEDLMENKADYDIMSRSI